MRNKSIIGGAVVVIAIVVLIIGFGGSSSPDKIVSQMFDKMTEVGTAAFDVRMTVPLGDDHDGALILGGAFDNNDADNIKSTLDGDFRVQSSGLSFGLAIESLTIDKKIYIKALIDNLPLPIDISFLNNRWIMTDVAAFQEQFGGDYPTKLTLDQREELRQVFRKSDFIKITRVLPDEVISGANNYHYQYVIDEDALVEYYAQVMEITQNRKFDALEKTSFRAGFDRYLEDVELFSGEIWIGKDDSLLYKLTLSISGVYPTGESVSSDLVLTFKDYGLPVVVEAPSDYISLDELLGILQGR
ncbi:MAG: hypothetical protein Q8Q37_00430 [bacterium]|nr:hypothetical protein [bacterium]